MTASPRVRTGWVVLLVAGGGLLPVALYAWLGGDPAAPAALPFRAAPAHEQWTAVLTGFVVKPIYMTGALLLAAWVWRQRAADLVALRWALVCFFIGEACCALNYLCAHDCSYLLEYLHSFGMVLTFACAAYALLEAVDLRLLHYSDPARACAAAPLCRGCIKHDSAPCGLRRVFLVLALALAVLALVPLLVPPRAEAYQTRIVGAAYTYQHALVYQVYEARVLPVAALVLLLACFGVLLAGERHPVPVAKLLLAAGVGALGFAWFRAVLLALFAANQVWFAAWEELTELLFVLGAGWVLRVFRRGLLTGAAGPEGRAADSGRH